MGPTNFKHLGDNKKTRSLAKGEAPTQQEILPVQKELAEVVSYNGDANSYTVLTRGVMGVSSMPGGKQLKDIPRKILTEGDVSVLEEGTIVVIDYSLGFPYIDGILNINISRADSDSSAIKVPNVGGDPGATILPTDNTIEDNGGFYRVPGTPKNLVSGDHALYTKDGNMIGALRGKYCLLDSGEGSKARIETIGDRDLVRITCEDFELHTGFGSLEIYNSEGRCGLRFRAAADQLNESGGDEERWTFKLDIGESGDYYTMEVSDPEGLTQAKLQFTADGKVELLGTNGTSLVNGSQEVPLSLESAADMVQRVVGKLSTYVDGVTTENYNSRRITTVSETDQRTVGHDDSLSVNHNQLENIAGNIERTVSGGLPINATPLNIAISEQVLNGSYFIEMGNPTLGGSPSALAGFTVAVNNGDITLGQNPEITALPAQRATVSLNTRLPSSVGLGCSVGPGAATNPPIYHAVMFEPLLTVLSAIILAHDTHVHVPPVLPPTVPTSPAISPLLPLCMSLRVQMGG